MSKPTVCVLRRHDVEDWCIIIAKVRSRKLVSMWFCWSDFAALCPVLTKGLLPDQSRNLVLKQTKQGISLSRVIARRKPKEKTKCLPHKP